MKVVEVIQKIGKVRNAINREYDKDDRGDMELVDILEDYINILENLIDKE